MNDRFTPRHPFSREQLEAYAKGDLPSDQQHEVELLLEESPLHSEAVDGLRGSPVALSTLERYRPKGGGSQGAWLWGAGVLLVAIGTLWFLGTRTNEHPVSTTVAPTTTMAPHSAPATEQAIDLIPASVIQVAQELPGSLQIGHRPPSQGILPDPPVDERPVGTVEVIEPTNTIQPTHEPQEAHALTPTKPSRRLLYLHDLKLVDPDEIYGREPQLVVAPGGVPANRSGDVTENPMIPDERAVPYTVFMDDVLGSFSRGDHRAALTDLRTLLQQRPDDVNALFYAGLCCYNLGLFDRASAFFDRAAHHSISTFDEEAEWYRALSLEQAGEEGTARRSFERIAERGGFYAGKARTKLHQ